MTPLPDAGTPGTSAAEDRASVLEMMGSPQMQRRLEEARAQRERVLAEKAAARGPEAQDPKVRLAWDRELGSIGIAGAVLPVPGGAAPALPWIDETPPPLPETSVEPEGRRGGLRSGALGVALGLMAGVVLGSGVMWLAKPVPSEPQSGLEVAVASPTPSALAVAPSLVLAGVGEPLDVPPPQAPVGGPPARDVPARIMEGDAGEGGTVEVTSAAPVEAASGLASAMAAPGAEPGVEVAVASPAAAVRPGPLPTLAVPSPPDAAPLPQDAPSAPGSGLPGLDWQVALHLPPGTSPEALQEAQTALRAVGVGLIVGAGASPFGVARSEVRFFHAEDAPDAARIAAAMGAEARDFSAYRPAPLPGSFEVWLAGNPPDAGPSG